MMNRHILLVEDNEDDVFLMEQAKKRAGVTSPMHVVDHGAKAIAYLNGEEEFGDRQKFPIPNLVLLDLKLPYVTGHEVLRWIRRESRFQTMLVIVLTSSGDSMDIDTAYRLGANSYLVKPSTVDELRDLVGSLADYWLRRNCPPTHISKAA